MPRKKAPRSWEPRNLLKLSDRAYEEFERKGMHPRWVAKDDTWRRQDLGYVFANDALGVDAEDKERYATQLGTTPERHDLVLMATDKENVEGYQSYVAEQADNVEAAIVKSAKQNAQHADLGPIADTVRGKVTVQDGTKVIE